MVCPRGRAEELLGKFADLLLRHHYGLHVETVRDFRVAGHELRRADDDLACVVVVQRSQISVRTTVLLGRAGAVPVVVLLPGHAAREQRLQCGELDNVHICAWEDAFGKNGLSLQGTIVGALQERRRAAAEAVARDVAPVGRRRQASQGRGGPMPLGES